MKCKICGTGSFADLKCAVDAGTDAVGFLMGITHVTQDTVTPEEAAAMIRTLPPFIEPVAVTHLQDARSIIDIIQRSRCTTVQIQNTISLEDITMIRDALPYIRILKAVHVMDASALNTAQEVAAYADAIILDTRTPERLGGTGLTHDWTISAKIVKSVGIPVILAGGLTPENVAAAIRQVHPYAVDVHTGVKKNDVRDALKTKAFVEAAHTTI
ncbi:MAG: phosphoribosylanthranilate isomerase [Methanocorpusculum sp.]|uniref:phosphoribosylanthranilate isomerase n=1 Tax=Methanocorpusculum sp. TaxID=2058474 RepID=UPI00272427BF|nr:phosphoribosylanthranilate isomerase [Methanocorpusculum sp.]MDO9522714.1 phosphoribosylanthranilate isomerase [Methanocorpusculum sp.]